MSGRGRFRPPAELTGGSEAVRYRAPQRARIESHLVGRRSVEAVVQSDSQDVIVRLEAEIVDCHLLEQVVQFKPQSTVQFLADTGVEPELAASNPSTEDLKFWKNSTKVSQ